MKITKSMVRHKAERIEAMLTPPIGKKFYFSVYNCGDGINRYQIGWKEDKTGLEYPIGYNWHIRGPEMYTFLEGIEEGLRLGGFKRYPVRVGVEPAEWMLTD